MPIAISTGSLYPLPTLDSIHHLQKLGIQDIELTLQPNEFQLTFQRELFMPILPDLRELVESNKLRVRSIHAPAIFHAHANNLWARKQNILYAIEICRQLDASILVVHPLHFMQHQEIALEYLAGNVSLQSALLPGTSEMIDSAQTADVILAMENIQDWVDEIFFNSPVNMSKFLRDINHPVFGCTLDLMHAQFPGLLDEFINSLFIDIVNIHAADLALPVKRAPIGEGVIDWTQLVPRLTALPNLRQITVELSDPQDEDITRSVHLLSSFMY
jgi:sugar phosphate isomerase/epimerase